MSNNDSRSVIEPRHAVVEVEPGLCVRVLMTGRVVVVPWHNVEQIVYATGD